MGYKVHLIESCDEDKPHLITTVHTINATEPDDRAVNPIHCTDCQSAKKVR